MYGDGKTGDSERRGREYKLGGGYSLVNIKGIP